jgi:ribonuclease HI
MRLQQQQANQKLQTQPSQQQTLVGLQSPLPQHQKQLQRQQQLQLPQQQLPKSPLRRQALASNNRNHCEANQQASRSQHQQLTAPSDSPLLPSSDPEHISRSGRLIRLPARFQNASQEPKATARINRQPIPFPLSYDKRPRAHPAPPPYTSYGLQAAYSLDGASRVDSSKRKSGAFAVVKNTPTRTSVVAFKILNASNNFAEFSAAEAALQDGVTNKHHTILIVSDSQLVFDFLRDANDIVPPHLREIAARVRSLCTQFAAIYVSKVYSHRKDSFLGNQVADALCTWALNSHRDHNLILQLTHHTLAQRLQSLNKSPPPPSNCCNICLKKDDHKAEQCPIFSFQHAISSDNPHCIACLSHDHTAERCPLYSNPQSRPALAWSKTGPHLDENVDLQDIASIDFDNIRFPSRQSGEQFDDYWETVLSTLFFAKDAQRQLAAEKAIAAWSSHYHVEGHSIRAHRSSSIPVDSRVNHNAHPDPPEDITAVRARKAAALGVDARPSDVTKALRSAPPITLTDSIREELQSLYPSPADDDVVFEPCPLPFFTISRHRVARYIMARSKRSHPGTLGLNFGILQLMCKRWYKTETSDAPNSKWTLFCELIAKIMSGNATLMSPMLHEVFGFCFDKNFEKPGQPQSIRNIGVEETLLRVPAALVFERVMPDAIERGFITEFDLGAGKRCGAEIFAKIAEMLATSGAVITVMDVRKAFNNLRRRDILAAVKDFGNPLLSAFIHFLFERNPNVTFRDASSGNSLTCCLKTGILQGNPLSVFVFALTIAYILRPLRQKFAGHSIIPAYVDDMFLASNPKQIQHYPEMLSEFFSTFNQHGLEFDFTEVAKTSVFSLKPLPAAVISRLAIMGIRTQTEGIAPCKCPFGSATFMNTFISKATAKLAARHQAFDALWPAMLAADTHRRKPTLRSYEQFLNLVRLSFLSMPMYTLRTVKPSFCEPYALAGSRMAESLICKVFPPSCTPPELSHPTATAFPNIDMLAISNDIMQLPLSRGGLSLRLPSSIFRIAYVSSCIDCYKLLHRAASTLQFPFDFNNFGDYRVARDWLIGKIPTITDELIYEALGLLDADFAHETTQQLLTCAFNSHEIRRIADALKPVPAYYFAFLARTDSHQEQASWPFNPKVRANLSIGPLLNSEFSRGLQIATLRPAFSQAGYCSVCDKPIDTVGLHLLKCEHTRYTAIHDTVKHSLASRLRSLMPARLAALSVLVEKPVNLFYKLKEATQSETIVRKSDIALLLSGCTQQDTLIIDLVSVQCDTPNGRDGFYFDLNRAEVSKRHTYSKYAIPPHFFFPLAFGRTNILSRETQRFCQVVGQYFPKTLKIADKLRATLSRSIVLGVATSFNAVMRRLQLSDANALAFSMVPPVPDSARHPDNSVFKQLAKIHAPLLQTPTRSLGPRLAAILTRDASPSVLVKGGEPRSLGCSLQAVCDSDP